MQFIKYHGLGNDFVLLEGTSSESPPIPPALAATVCSRGEGVGADGVMRARPSDRGHLAMELLNADGSTPEMCGNGIRCLVKYAVEELGIRENPMDVDTVAGMRRCTYTIDGAGRVTTVRVEMGPVPAVAKTVDGHEGWAVDVGNPHFVLFGDPAASDRARARELGAHLATHPDFPAGANIEFVEPLSDSTLQVTVYERGCGLTRACGTGATAVVAAAVRAGRTEPDTDTVVRLPGGNLTIRVLADGAQSWMEGPAIEVYRGRLT